MGVGGPSRSMNLTAQEVCTHNLFTGSNVYAIYTLLIDAIALQYFSWLKLIRIELLQQIPLRLANIPPLKTCNQSLRARFCTLLQVCSVDPVLLICVEWPALSDVKTSASPLSCSVAVCCPAFIKTKRLYIIYHWLLLQSLQWDTCTVQYILIGHCEYHQWVLNRDGMKTIG